MNDRQLGILGLMFYTMSLKGISRYHLIALPIIKHIFKRCDCHKDIKHSKADHLQ